VLGADAPCLRELLRGTPSRTVAAGDADALRHGLRLALTRPWADAARDYAPAALARFEGGRAARRLIALFDRLSGETSGGRNRRREGDPISAAA